MPTRFYLRHEPATQPGAPDAAAASDDDGGHVGAVRLVCLGMSTGKGRGGDWTHWRQWDEQPSAPSHRDLVGLWISPALAMQTLPAGQSFSLAYTIDETVLADGHCYPRGFVYLWRPGVGWVATLSAASAASRDTWGRVIPSHDTVWRRLEFPALGADVEVRLGDRVVGELWVAPTVEMSQVSLGNRVGFDGGTDQYEDGDVDATDPASFCEYSGTLILASSLLALDPDNILVGPRELLIDGRNVGAVVGGSRIEIEEVEVEQQPDIQIAPERVDVTARRLTLVCQIEAATLDNLAIAWGLPPGAVTVDEDGTITLVAGTVGTRPIHEVIARGEGPGTNSTRTIRIPLATIVKPTGHSYLKAEATAYEVHFLALADPDTPEQILMEITDEPGEQFVFEP